jgi:hypothetical protein
VWLRLRNDTCYLRSNGMAPVIIPYRHFWAHCRNWIFSRLIKWNLFFWGGRSVVGKKKKNVFNWNLFFIFFFSSIFYSFSLKKVVKVVNFDVIHGRLDNNEFFLLALSLAGFLGWAIGHLTTDCWMNDRGGPMQHTHGRWWCWWGGSCIEGGREKWNKY